MTSPLTSILDRDQPARDVRKNFAPQLEVLRDVVNYGSNLIVRCYESSQKGLAEAVILGALLKHAVAMVDGVEIHVSNAAVLASHAPLRALYEAHLYLLWILANDTDRRARHYYVWNLRQQRLWAKRSIRGTAEHTAFLPAGQVLPPSDMDTFLDKYQQQASAEVNEIDKLLSLHYREINDAFDKCRKRDYDPPWHAPCGAPSIRKLANDLKLLLEYETIYSTLSRFAHANCLRSHVSFRPEITVFQPIRRLESLTFVLNTVLYVAFRTYRAVLNQYRSGEIENYNRKYIQDWQKAFMAIPNVKESESLQERP